MSMDWIVFYAIKDMSKKEVDYDILNLKILVKTKKLSLSNLAMLIIIFNQERYKIILNQRRLILRIPFILLGETCPIIN